MYLISTVDPSTVCVSIKVNYFESGKNITPEIYHISDVKVDGVPNRPTYKLEGGDAYIYYFPDAYGWRIGVIINGTEEKFSSESMLL